MSKIKFAGVTALIMSLFSILFSLRALYLLYSFPIRILQIAYILLSTSINAPIKVLREALPFTENPITGELFSILFWALIGFVYGIVWYLLKSKAPAQVHFRVRDVFITMLAQIIIAMILTLGFSSILHATPFM